MHTWKDTPDTANTTIKLAIQIINLVTLRK